MLFILSIFFLSLKLSLQLFEFLLSYKGPLIKIFIIIILIEILYLLTTIGLAKFIKLSELRKSRQAYFTRYSIANFSDHIWNIGYIIYYISIFIGLLLWLRFNNSKNTFDIKESISKFKFYVFSNSLLDNLLSIIIIVLCIIIYIIIIMKSNKRFGFEVTRLHLFFSRFQKYQKLFCGFPIGYKNYYIYFQLRKLSLYHLPNNLFLYRFEKFVINPFLNYFKIWFHFSYHSHKFILNLHYIVLFTILFYDLIFNQFILSNYFKFLPYFFIYAIWLRFSHAIGHLSLVMDYNLSMMLYGKFQIIDDEIHLHDGMCIILMNDLVEYYKYLNNGLYDLDFQRMDNESKGFIIKFIDKIVNKVLKIGIIQKLLKYNYRAKLIKIHRINLKIVKLGIILLLIWLIIL
jgi:hypothetical protein